MDKKTTSWGKVAEWYDELLDGNKDTYQSAVILPNILRLLDPRKTDFVADIACGQGFFVKSIAPHVAKVIGSDISPELVGTAKSKAEPNTEYFVSMSHELSKITGESVDKAITILALQNIEKINETCKEISRILKKGSVWCVVLNHPAFRVPKRSGWEWDEKNKKQYRRIDAYMSESKDEIDMNPGESDTKNKKSTISFHRPLQVYFKAFEKAGLAVTRLEEWTTHKMSKEDGENSRGKEENRMKKEIPMFMALVIKKL